MAEQPVMWRQVIDRRLMIAAVMCGLWTAGIEMRLVYLQTIAHKDLAARAERQQMRTLTVPAKRGEIYDRRGQLLAFSVDADTIYAVPIEIANTAQTAAALCAALEGCDGKEHQSLVERLGRQRAFVYVKRRVSPTEARKVADLNLEGVGFMKESRRFYPNKELAAHVVGYVGLDNVGLHGLEASYDKVIRGHEGTILVQTDAKRRAFSRLGRVPTSGGSLELTIDDQLQYMVERELRMGVESSNAAAGTAVVMNPRTGELLAMANWPTFNPNAYNGASEEARRNRAVQDLYEPGSTFKIVTASAAIEEQVLPIDSFIDTSPGVIRFGNRVIDEYAHKNYGVLSFTDVLVKSSNIGAIKIGLKIGPERLGLFIRRFGFGRPTSSDFPAESPGIVWDPSKLNDSALASISMGYQVGVTPLQMAAAISAVANGGQWIEPRVVQAVIRDGIRTRVAPTVVRTAITARTAAALLPILEAVVKDGTGGSAEIPGYTVAGKTGTADKLVGGRYSQSQQNVSFVGFVPSRNPAVTVVVMIDSPRASSNSGGRVAAPIFKRIAEATLRHLGVPPDVDAPPPVMVARRAVSPITQTSSATAPAILTVAADAAASSSFPDLRGLSARDALRTLSKFGVAARMEGKGIVVSQTPAPGTALEGGTTCTLVLERDGSRLAAMSGAQR